MAGKKRDLASLVVEAQKSAERHEVDDKYRPALFYYFLTRAGKNVDEGTPLVPPVARKRIVGKEGGAVRASAPAAIQALHVAHFFKEGKTIQQVSERLAKEGYHFGYETTKKALQRADFLLGEGEKSDRKYFQRYPAQ